MRRFETKTNKISGLSVSRTKKYSYSGEDVTDILDTDEDRVLLYHTHDNKNQPGLLNQPVGYNAERNWKGK